jgi:hypothetical protein
MDKAIVIVLGLALAQIVTFAQENSDLELARSLASTATQEKTV